MKTIQILPYFLVGIIFPVTNFLIHKLRLSVPQIGLERGHFGTALVTSVGMLGYKDAFAPQSPVTGVFVVTVNKASDAPVVDDGELKIGRVMNINVKFDHRYIVGARAKHFTTIFENVFEEPEKFLESP